MLEFSPSEKSTAFAIKAVERQTLRQTISAFGRLEPAAIADVRQVVAGKINKINSKVGDSVRVGEIVATIDPTLQALTTSAAGMEVKEAEALIIERQAELALRRDQVERSKSLGETGAVTKFSLLENRTNLQISISRLAQARARLDKLRAEFNYQEVVLEMMKLKSPLNGQVLEVLAREGEFLNAEQTTNLVMTIGKTDVLILEAMVSEADVLRLFPGQAAKVTLVSEQDIAISSEILRIQPNPVTVNGATLYVVELEVENDDNRLRVGMSARVDFFIAERNDALVVPPSAIGSREGAPVVAISNQSGFVVVPVGIGLTTRIHQEIISGLSEGDTVLVPFPEF